MDGERAGFMMEISSEHSYHHNLPSFFTYKGLLLRLPLLRAYLPPLFFIWLDERIENWMGERLILFICVLLVFSATITTH